MKKIKKTSCLRAAMLLLCLFVLQFLGCGSLKTIDNEVLLDKNSILQLAIREIDFTSFREQILEMELDVIDFRPAKSNAQNGDAKEYWVTFRFNSKRDFLIGSTAVMSTGLAYRISYNY